MRKKIVPPSGSSTIKVGDIKEYIIVLNKQTGKPSNKPIFYSYKDIEYDFDGWADSKKFLPEDYDLVHLRLIRERTVAGWISGTTWNGLRLKPDDIVTCWKRKLEEDAS